MQNFIVILIVAVIIGLASRYIYKEKKRGVKCIGCPDSVKRRRVFIKYSKLSKKHTKTIK